MRHRKNGKHLGRTASHRKALRRNLACALFTHGSIRTTKQKAREVRQFAERLITLGKKGGLAGFRRALAMLDDKRIVKKLFGEIAPRYTERPGGYTRMLKLSSVANRLGDQAAVVILELVEEEMPERKVKAAPAPKAEAETEPTDSAEEEKPDAEEEESEDEDEESDEK